MTTQPPTNARSISTQTDSKASPFHDGERAIQARLGVVEQMERVGRRVIRDFMPDQHRTFFAQLPYAVFGAVDPEGDVWATFVTGDPGFMASPTPKTLVARLALGEADPAARGVDIGRALGVLGIDLSNRRRNRMNGVVVGGEGDVWEVEVGHSFGNCPQYIQRRSLRRVDRATHPVGLVSRSQALTPEARAMIEASDVFYVASYVDVPGDARHVDVSHRGGKPGFVRVEPDGALTVPDFAGNMAFNTLGNFMLNPKAGLTWVDLERGDVLQMTGDAEVIFASPELEAFEGAERLWRFTPRAVVLRRGALDVRGALVDWSPNSLMTGSWAQAEARVEAAAAAARWRPFKVTRVVDESASIRSFHLAPDDGLGAARHEAGQHVAVRLATGAQESMVRTYTLSCAPSDAGYRISVKRDGAMSRALHSRVGAGDHVELRAPSGDFTIDPHHTRPALMLAAGVGITPLLAMLRHVVFEGLRTRRVRPTVLVYAARTRAERAFDDEIDALIERAGGALRCIRVLSAPEPDARRGDGFDVRGRVSPALVRELASGVDLDAYLCGPPSFMQDVYDALRAVGVPDPQIHAEGFGPAALVRDAQHNAPALAPVADTPTQVLFAQSAKEARWLPDTTPSLLALAEGRGLNPAYGCRSGHCGACKVRVVRGGVTYRDAPGARVDDGEALLCCAVPAAGADGPLVLDV